MERATTEERVLGADESLDRVVKKVGPGGRVLLYDGFCNSWMPHRQGVVIRLYDFHNTLQLNGTKTLSQRWTRYHSSGFGPLIVEQNHSRFRDGDVHDEVCRGHCDEFRSHPKGVVLNVCGQFRLNGKKFICQGECDAWVSHPQGVLMRRGDQFLLNGKQCLYQGDQDGWAAHPQGVVIRRGNDFLLNGRGPAIHTEPYLHGWSTHRHGLIFNTSKMHSRISPAENKPHLVLQVFDWSALDVDGAASPAGCLVPDWVQDLAK